MVARTGMARTSLRCPSRREAAVGLLIVVVTVLCAVGCRPQPVPEQDLAAAKRGLEDARAAEAETLATEAFRKGNEALQAAEAEIAAQNSKSALSRRYEAATRHLATAISEFKNAADEANRALVFTGTILDDDGKPDSGVSLKWSEVTVKGGTLTEHTTIRFEETDRPGWVTLRETNPVTVTDSSGKFTLRIHPKHHPEYLEPKKQYAILFVKRESPLYTARGFIKLRGGPFLWSLDTDDGRLLQKSGSVRVDLGSISRK